ncbi:hypothetical protein [Agromyces albus]|uniref:hypothetical protein n=1 Tax=Agromyces albus TaxID=205332 RepID=UPI00277E5DA0|nr:hypothetical protein [Agromyces albus]MDQ0574256.1 hypothetical protein [Agromyces albus]
MERDDVASRLVAALERGDELALASLLNPEVRLLVDTGDETGGEQRGRARVIRTLTTRLARHPDAALLTVRTNGGPGLALRRRDGEVVGVLGIGTGLDGSIVELWLSTATRKLAHWNRRRPDAG